MQAKRVTLLAGHYGSGKTNIAVNYALHLRRTGAPVTVADLDIVNPYFRTKDSAQALAAAGVRLICSEFANSNLDLPALPQELYSVLDDRSGYAVLDIGGDDRGAYALGRLTPGILAENDYEMVLVVNCYRPLTATSADALEIMREIEAASRIPFTAIVNNSNLGEETQPQDVLNSVDYAEELSQRTGLPILFTAVEQSLLPQLQGRIQNLFPLALQEKMI